jgi:tricorn protease
MRLIKNAAMLCITFFSVMLFAEHQPHAGMLRSPHVSDSQIVFLYAQQLWVVSKEGGLASPLANPPGVLTNPRFSPDGKTVAFSANYDGNGDLYTIPVQGGVPFRVTHHPSFERLSSWSPDGQELLFSGYGEGEHPRTTQVFRVSASGGLPVMLPVPYGDHPTISKDGEWLAYTPNARDRRTWKRYRGGMASDVWLFNLKNKTSRQITNWEGTDSFPMWHGKKVYFLSDQGVHHRLNIWVFDLDSGKNTQVTFFDGYDVKNPAVGPSDIIFQNGAALFLLNLKTLKTHSVDVRIPGDRVQLKEKWVDAGKHIRGGSISSTGKRAVFSARGDIWTLPAVHGSARNLTRTDGVHERSPVWSPDKRWIVFSSDKAGSYDLYKIAADGSSEPEKITDLKARFLYALQWSPDSKSIAFWNRGGDLYLIQIEKGMQKGLVKIAVDPRLQKANVSFSSDSRYIAYSMGNPDTTNASVYIYDIEKAENHRVTSDFFNSSNPVFDREGKYLFFSSNRYFEKPTYEDLGTSWIYNQTEKLYVIPLTNEEVSPFAPLNDEEKLADSTDDDDVKKGEKKGDDNADGDKEGEAKGKEKKDEKAKPVKIDFAGLSRRAVALPVEAGSFRNLAVNHKGNLLYVQSVPGEDGASIMLFDLKDEKRKAKKVIKSYGFDISADGKKILIATHGKFAVVDAKPKQRAKEMVPSDGMNSLIQPRHEWKEIFTEAWRFYRGFFYDPHLHGVDWDAVYQQYEAMLPDCVSRADLSYIIREMISELNVGHAYYRPGPEEFGGPHRSTGLLGVDWELDQGAYRIAKVYHGAVWDSDARGPVDQPGVKLSEGDYILSVNGLALDPTKDPWASFAGLAGKTVTLKVSSDPTGKESRDVVLTLLRSERGLKYRNWVEAKRRYVEVQSNGEIGYIYVPNTGIEGQNELVRQFFGQIGKKALIIDERWNGGGQIPTRFIELLNRPVANYWALRDGTDWVWPPDSHQGPKCMLINGLAGSGGDYFPYWFKHAGVGKLIGTRTWGGLVGYSSEPSLLDGARVTIPTFAFYEKDGTWGIEGHGVDPDIVVIDDPAKMQDGGDPQLDRAIEEMQKEVKAHPFVKPPRPEYPNRQEMGIKEEDK